MNNTNPCIIMKNKLSSFLLYSFIVLSLFCWFSKDIAYAQGSSEKQRLLKRIAETEAEIARLSQTKDRQNNQTKYCFEKVVFNEQISMSNEEFEAFCKKEIPQITVSSSVANYAIISSCKQGPQGLQANYCISAPPLTLKPIELSKNSADVEKELTKIRNTKKMYQDLINSLYKELEGNGVEIVDESLNLAVKHINIESAVAGIIRNKLKDLKDNMMIQLRQEFNIEERNIENENAQIVDDMTNQAEKLTSIIPGGKLATCHYLWRILKSTPEIGKVLGDSGAMVNIYFQIDEFQKKLQQLEEREKAIMK